VAKLYRTLFRVVAVFGVGGYIRVVCPGWDSKIGLDLPMSKLPDWLRDSTPLRGLRFYARCDLDCVDVPTMQASIQDFEPAPELDPLDGLA
jgi:hypothetical protein